MEYPVIWRIEDIYFPVLSVVGIPVNLLAIVILSRGKSGLSTCITRYLVGMAAADLLVVISDPLLRQTIPIHFPLTFRDITPVCSLIAWLVFASTTVSFWLTVTFSFDRFVAICCEKFKMKYCTDRAAAVVIGTVSALGCLENIPRYFVYEPREIVDNVPWFCSTKASFYTSPAWTAFDMFHRTLTPCIPFFLLLLLNILTARRILAASRVRRGLRGHGNGENDKDPEMENRRKSIVLLFSLTGSFILLWVTQVMFYIYKRIASVYEYPVVDPHYITESTAIMLQLLSLCTNTCIYVVTQSRFREELKKAMKYPLQRIVKSVKLSGEIDWSTRKN